MHKINSTKPAVGKVKRYFFLKFPLWSDPIKITNQQHFYQNNGIDRFSANMRILGRCLFVYKIKIYTVFNLSQKMIFRNHRIQVKDYQPDLSALFSHHKKWSPAINIINIAYRKPFLFSLSTGPSYHVKVHMKTREVCITNGTLGLLFTRLFFGTSR